MKKWLLQLLTGFLVAMPLLAHPPAKVSIAFVSESSRIDVTISHEVKDAENHFIDELIIKVNEVERIRQTCLRQTDTKTQVLSYVLPSAKSGDEIEVSAKCNKYGIKTVKYTIP